MTIKHDELPRGATVPPLFFWSREAPQDLDAAELGDAISHCFKEVLSPHAVVGAGKFGRIWKVIMSSIEYRAAIAGKSMSVDGKVITFLSKDPTVLVDREGNVIESTRISISGLPINIPNGQLADSLEKLGVQFRSGLKFENAKNKDGSQSRFLNFRRFAYVDTPKSPFPPKFKVGPHQAFLYHKEQKPCFDCKEVGHKRGDPKCKGIPTNPTIDATDSNVSCFTCKEKGHKRGDPMCKGPKPMLNGSARASPISTQNVSVIEPERSSVNGAHGHQGNSPQATIESVGLVTSTPSQVVGSASQSMDAAEIIDHMKNVVHTSTNRGTKRSLFGHQQEGGIGSESESISAMHGDSDSSDFEMPHISEEELLMPDEEGFVLTTSEKKRRRRILRQEAKKIQKLNAAKKARNTTLSPSTSI